MLSYRSDCHRQHSSGTLRFAERSASGRSGFRGERQRRDGCLVSGAACSAIWPSHPPRRDYLGLPVGNGKLDGTALIQIVKAYFKQAITFGKRK